MGMRNNDVSPHDESLKPDFDLLPSVPISRRTPEVRKEDMDNVLGWLRQNKDPSFDLSGEFTKVDQFLPEKKGQKPKERAREIENTLDWMRSAALKPSAELDIPLGFEKLGSVPISRRTPEERKRDVDDVMNWLRNGKPEFDDPTGDFTRLDQLLPKKKGHTSKDRARDIEGTLDWMRNMGLVLDETEPRELFSRLPLIPSSVRSPEDRKDDVENVLNWLRSPGDENLDPTGEFSQIDEALPQKRGQTPESRSIEIEQALDWSRNNFVNSEPLESDGVFNTVGLLGLTRRGPEE